ncbi:MAG: hypothetical protein ISR91_01855 [Candidatus Delongbacteria bacterium]|nr:hypothetical protein [Candidatus Delongbacteria bacterium]
MQRWMITSSILITLILQTAVASAVEVEATRSLMKIDDVTPPQMQLLARGHYQVDRVYDNEVELWLNTAELEKLLELGLQPYSIPDQAYEMFLHLQATSRDDGGWRDYHNYSQLTGYLQDLHDTFPDITQLFSIGQTVQGRELWVLQITDNPTIEENEPEFKYISTIHGNEPVGTELLLELCDLLLYGYGTVPRYTAIIDNINLFILPMMNPDGNNAGNRTNANGVDLNRNFPDQYDDPINTPDGREPETGLIMNWTAAHNFILSANFHTGAVVVNYPFDSNPEGTNTFSPSPDEDLFVDMSETYSVSNLPMWNGNFYHGITNGADWYCIYGGMQDWNYVWMGNMEVTVELSNTSWPDASYLPQLWDDNRESMLAYMEYCLEGIRGIVTDADTGLPLAATVELAGNDHETYSDPVVGDYHRLCLPGFYTLVISKQFYETATIPGVFVSSDLPTVVDVVLTPLEPTPDLQLVATLIDDGGNGVLDPGETAWLTLELANEGNQPATGTVGTLEGMNPELTITDGEGGWGTINPATTAWNSGNPFELAVAADCPLGEELPLQLALTAGDYTTTINFSLTVGLQLEDFESGGFATYPWEMGGNSNWIISGAAYEGDWCAQSGNIGNNQTSVLQVTVDVVAPGDISFQYKVSSEANYDYLIFKIDDMVQASWAGEEGWSEYSCPLTTGEHLLSWIFDKDNSVSHGSDCGWIDYIVFPPLGAPAFAEIEVSPAVFDIMLAPDDFALELLTINNNGGGVLDYSMQVSTNSEPTTVPHLELRKGEADPRSGQFNRNQGGPDSFGYFWIDSDEPGGPAYSWIEINGFGTVPGGADDGNYGPFPLGFTLDYYAWAYDAIRICTNGWVSFTSTDDAYDNQGIPDSALPNCVIAPFWDDLNPSGAGTIYYYADAANQRFIVEWDGVVHYGNTDAETFQVIINADGTFRYQYKTVTDGTGCTVGIENQDGSDGLQIVFNAPYLHDELAILIDYTTPWLTVSQLAGTVDPYDYTILDVYLNSAGLAEAVYNGSITVNSNDPDNPTLLIPVTLEVGSVPPGEITDLGIEYTGSSIRLYWSAVPGATLYHIYECDTPFGIFVETGTTTVTEITRPLSANRFFQITADN